jgi:aspartyl-tRNA(Asn)/glutamyl-tRNA(Gln) amidotransferase subunit B
MMNKKQKVRDLLGGYELVLGLEIHLHVNTPKKMFCSCSTEGIYDAEPNTHVCPVCLGMPGALPVPNQDAVEKTQLLGLALGSELSRNSLFDRKHYFYPDLPKGYQISQYENPLCVGGSAELSSGRVVQLERIHLEEDTAKSFHEGQDTLIDFNKSGVALIEMVTTPSIFSVEDAVEYASKVQEIVRHLGVGEANMERGQLRIEPNISLRTPEMAQKGELAPYKVEVKNINSFRFMEKAVLAEISRQREILESGETPVQENRGYDEKANKTVPQRSKEEAHDYRYFPEPDIPPMEFSDSYVEGIKRKLKPLPETIKQNLMSDYGLSRQEAEVMYSEDLLDRIDQFSSAGVDIQEAVKLLVNRPEFRESSVDEVKKCLEKADTRINDVETLNPVIEEVIKNNPEIAAQISTGKVSAANFLIGQVMQKTKGKADPQSVREILKEKLDFS